MTQAKILDRIRKVLLATAHAADVEGFDTYRDLARYASDMLLGDASLEGTGWTDTEPRFHIVQTLVNIGRAHDLVGPYPNYEAADAIEGIVYGWRE